MSIRHISIIADGNRRWAKSKGLYESLSHGIAGNYSNINGLANYAKSMEISNLSLWAFSAENWSRNKYEIREIFDTIERGVGLFIENANINKYHVSHLGRKDRIPKRLSERLELLDNRTKEYNDFNLIFGIDYGGNDELKRMVAKIIASNIKNLKDIDLTSFLDIPAMPNADLIIRTGGEQRLSGYLPLHSAYSELYFVDKSFPEFTVKDLGNAIEEYEKRERRFGK